MSDYQYQNQRINSVLHLNLSSHKGNIAIQRYKIDVSFRYQMIKTITLKKTQRNSKLVYKEVVGIYLYYLVLKIALNMITGCLPLIASLSGFNNTNVKPEDLAVTNIRTGSAADYLLSEQ